MSYSINDKYSDVFGVVLNNVLPRVAPVGLGGALAYINLDTYEDEGSIVARTKSGAPVFDVVTLAHPDMVDGKYEFLLPIIYNWRRKKRENVTVINEGEKGGFASGEVVESSGWEPWSITMRGLIVDEENHWYPNDQIEQFTAIANIHDGLDVSSFVTQAMGISYVRITSLDFSDTQFRDTVSFTMQLKSYEPLDALILD